MTFEDWWARSRTSDNGYSIASIAFEAGREAERNSQQLCTLAEGEIYVGAIGNTNGNLTHIILLPGDNDDACWQHQNEWAASIGGELPTRLEQLLLLSNCLEHFKKDFYWAADECALNPDDAWYQYFDIGHQSCNKKQQEFRARAVRRVEIQ